MAILPLYDKVPYEPQMVVEGQGCNTACSVNGVLGMVRDLSTDLSTTESLKTAALLEHVTDISN